DGGQTGDRRGTDGGRTGDRWGTVPLQTMTNDIRAVLAATPSIVEALVSPLSDAALAFREAPATWSPREVVCHLVAAEGPDWSTRVEILLSDAAERRFTPFNREGGRQTYGAWTIDALTREFGRLRADNLARLAAFRIRDDMLARTAIHPELGTVTLAQHLACWATHDLAHINQISRALVRHFGPGVGPWKAYFSLLKNT